MSISPKNAGRKMTGISYDNGASKLLKTSGKAFPNCKFFHAINEDTPLSSYSLEDLLPRTLMSTPITSAQHTDKMWVITAMLCRYLETFTDGVIIMKNEKPLGVLGGRETLARILLNPTLGFFEEHTAGQVMTEHVNIISRKTTLSDLLLKMIRQRIGIAIVPYDRVGYAAISIRIALEIAAQSKSDMRASEMPKRDIVTFNREDRIQDVITSMFQYQTRKLVLDDYSAYISDRGILEKIALGLNYLAYTPDFLDLKAGLFNLKQVRKIHDDLTIPTLAKIMLGMDVPYVMVQDQIISPWDIA
ncbi:MAG: hypothetical protein ACE5DT_05110, partial [Nitrosopumilus sp.]